MGSTNHWSSWCAVLRRTAAQHCLVDRGSTGHKVEIRNTLVNNSYEVFVPQRWDQAPSVISMPPDVTQDAPLQNRLLEVTTAVANDISRDDQKIGLVTAVGPTASAAGVMQWDYINMLMIDCAILPQGLGAECPGDWWLSYSSSLWAGLRQVVTKIWFQDEIQDHTPCVSDSNWVDSQG